MNSLKHPTIINESIEKINIYVGSPKMFEASRIPLKFISVIKITQTKETTTL